jgi:hypothetical protein
MIEVVRLAGAELCSYCPHQDFQPRLKLVLEVQADVTHVHTFGRSAKLIMLVLHMRREAELQLSRFLCLRTQTTSQIQRLPLLRRSANGTCAMFGTLPTPTQAPTVICLSPNFTKSHWGHRAPFLLNLPIAAYRFWTLFGRRSFWDLPACRPTCRPTGLPDGLDGT